MSILFVGCISTNEEVEKKNDPRIVICEWDGGRTPFHTPQEFLEKNPELPLNDYEADTVLTDSEIILAMRLLELKFESMKITKDVKFDWSDYDLSFYPFRSQDANEKLLFVSATCIKNEKCACSYGTKDGGRCFWQSKVYITKKVVRSFIFNGVA